MGWLQSFMVLDLAFAGLGGKHERMGESVNQCWAVVYFY